VVHPPFALGVTVYVLFGLSGLMRGLFLEGPRGWLASSDSGQFGGPGRVLRARQGGPVTSVEHDWDSGRMMTGEE